MPPAPAIQVLLVCVSGPDSGKRIAVTDSLTTVGRASICGVVTDDPDTAERHVSLHLDDGKPVFSAHGHAHVFVDGHQKKEGRLEPGQQLRIGRSLWRIAIEDSPNSFSDFLGNIGGRISDVAGVERLQGFDLGAMLSEVWRRRSDEEMERYFAVGTPTTTPPLSEVDTNWPKPWLFFKTFALAALVYAGFVFAFNRFDNDLIVPGLIMIGSFVIPFSLLIFFFEVNVLRNVPLYQLMKLLFLGGILSLILSLFLFEWTKLSTWLGAMSAGIIEEAGKAAALLLVINKLKYRWTLNGLLFGAAVGVGFAAFESAGYAYLSGVSFGDSAMLQNITLRGILSICGGHVLWTALVGGALWRVRGDRRFQWSMLTDVRFVRVFALCAAMHMLWNSPIRLPFYLKYIALGFVAWVALLSFIQSGLHQVRAAQATGATEFFKRQQTSSS
jgi:RsiW-degrading membrane proteinase PrsW (M82 family)